MKRYISAFVKPIDMNDNRRLLQQFLTAHRVDKGHSALTVESYRNDLTQYLDYIDKSPEQSTANDVVDFLHALQSEGLSQKTLARKRSAIKSFYRFLDAEEISHDVNFELVPSIKLPDSLPDVLSHEETERLLDGIPLETALDWRNKAMFEFMYATGARISEVISLSTHDLIPDMRMCRILGKGSKQRYVPVAEVSWDYLQVYLQNWRMSLKKEKNTSTVFLNRTGSRLSRMGIWKLLREAILRVGINHHVSPHTLRHTCATHLLEGGANLRVVQELLGHASINTTQIYTNIDIDHLVEQHRLYHPRNRK
jgi:integrase/recombinase XerD